MNKLYRLLRFDLPLHFVLLFTNWLPDNVLLIRFRGWLASPFFKKSGKNIQIGRNVTFYNPSQISIGNNVYIAIGCWFSANAEIKIGNNILFGPYVVVVTSNHTLKNGAYFWGDTVNKATVQFDDGCWIGAQAVVMSGSFVGKSSLIAANSVFNGTSEEYSIYAGTPAKLIKYANREGI